MWKLLVCSAAFALGTSAVAQTDIPRPITEQEKQHFRELISSRLKDPDSAQYKWYPEWLERNVYCGYVNAKNSFGGYTGFRLYYVLFSGKNLDRVTVSISSPRDLFGNETAVCERYLAAPSPR